MEGAEAAVVVAENEGQTDWKELNKEQPLKLPAELERIAEQKEKALQLGIRS